GADARQPDAVAKIYQAKGRPSNNPLIVHLGDAAAVATYVNVTPTAQKLMNAFWPGPMTVVLPLRGGHGLADAVTAGLATLAVRVPKHPVAQSLLSAFDGPVAAPSANRSGKISPTTPDHVRAGLADRIDGLVVGPNCDVGLESTIIGFDPDPVILRPGNITPDRIMAITGHRPRIATTPTTLTAPGQMASHYAPNATVRLNVTDPSPDDAVLGFGPMACDINLSANADLNEAAENLFAALYQLDQLQRPIAVAPIPDQGVGIAINDRLKRAAAPRD
ncbi:MAG: L-threonylcarbamoyladenylate synthase, partial [Planktomarina sp.]